MSGVVYTIDEEGYIIAERHMDFDYAIQMYWGTRDSRNRRLFIALEGKEVPFKRRPKRLATGLKQEQTEALTR